MMIVFVELTHECWPILLILHLFVNFSHIPDVYIFIYISKYIFKYIYFLKFLDKNISKNIFLDR